MTHDVPDNLRSAFEHCTRLTRAHYENFPVASWLLPAGIRPFVGSIYAFARTADDFADEPGLEPQERLAKLDDWRKRLDACLSAPEGPIFEALAETIRQFDIPMPLLEDLLDAFCQDVRQSRHATFEALIDYSKRSANPVGRLVLILFGYADDQLFEESDAICTALQLTNFWQDIAVDFTRGRIYLPQQEMAKHGVTEKDLEKGETTPAFKNLINDMIARTRALFEQGRVLPERVHGRLRFELRMTWLGGVHVLQAIEAVDYDLFHHRPTVGKATGAYLLFRALRTLPTSA